MAAVQHIASRVRADPLVIIAWACFALIVPLAYVLNIWQDEAYTLHTTAGGVAYAFAESLRFEQNAPLYFVLLDLWRQIDGSVFFLRLFSVLCSAATLSLVRPLAARYLPRTESGLLLVGVAWNPFFIWSAVEMRVYAMVVLLSALLLLTFYDAFLAERPARYAPALYAFCVAAALYTQYYLGFLVAAQFAVLLWSRRDRLISYVLSAALAGAAFLPLLRAVPGQVQNYREPFTPPSSLLASCGVFVNIISHFVLPLPIAHGGRVYAALILLAALAAVVLRRSLVKSADALVPVLTALAAFLFAAATYGAGVHVLNRHAASLFVPGVLSVYGILTFLRPGVRERAAIVWCCIAAAASLSVIGIEYRHMAKPGDWIRVVATLREHERPGEPIAVFEAENALPFEYYYHGPNRVVAVPHAVSFRRYDVLRFVVHGQSELAATMPHAQRIWLITAGECASANVRFGCGVVEQYVARHYRTVYDARFYESRLRLLSPLHG